MTSPKAEGLRYRVRYFADGAILYARILRMMCWPGFGKKPLA
jgi:hypothetical protein